MEYNALDQDKDKNKSVSSQTMNKYHFQIDAVQVIQMIADIAVGNKTPKVAAQEFCKPIQTAARVFARDQAEAYVKTGLASVGLQKLDKQDFARHLVDETEIAAKLIRRYMSGEIDELELVEKLGSGEIQDLTNKVFAALGIHDKLGMNNMSEVIKLSPLALAFTASAAAYQELSKALDDLSVAREERIRIESACQESIALIKQYRQDMEQIVNQYLTEHLETFESGFMAMDKALIENDVDGYIKGNAEIQSILGYQMQFRNQDEFDLLMDSEETFKL